MYHCNLAKIPVSPLFSRISNLSSRSGGRLSRYFSTRSQRKSMGSAGACPVGSFRCHMRSFESMHEKKGRLFSSRSQKVISDDGDGTGDRMALPWLTEATGDKERKGIVKVAAMKTKRSSWEEAAESFLARSEGDTTTRANLDKGNTAKESEFHEDEDEEDVEPLDDPRWDRIKDKYKGLTNRESRFGEPENAHGWNKQESWERKASKEAALSRFEKPEVRRWNKQENWGKKTWKEATEPSSIPKMVGQSVYGVGPVLAAMVAERREFYALYVQEGLDVSGSNKKKKDKKAVEKVLQIAERVGLKVVEASKHDLNMVVENRPHQGLVLDASPLEMVNIRGLDPVMVECGIAPLWVALDEVTDPQNLGAIIRSAYFFGADGVVLCAKNSAPLSGVVSKASAGSLERIELLSCKNMMQFLSLSAENGWRVLGGSVSSKAVPLCEVEVGLPTILVLGSEGSGLRPLVERSCTQLIRIPGNTPLNGYETTSEVDSANKDHFRAGHDLNSFVAVESLNVSVAAGVLLYHLVGKKNSTCK